MGQISRRRFLVGTAAATALLGRAPAALGQQVKELQVWHTEVEPQTVKTIADTSIASATTQVWSRSLRAINWARPRFRPSVDNCAASSTISTA